LRDKLEENTKYFRAAMSQVGFNILPGEHPIVPIILGEAALAGLVAEAMLAKGVYVVGFSYPVVPQGKARIRTQISAGTRGKTWISPFAVFGRSRRSQKNPGQKICPNTPYSELHRHKLHSQTAANLSPYSISYCLKLSQLPCAHGALK
jgi:predicted alpha/beta-hydrolase family hydrolase